MSIVSTQIRGYVRPSRRHGKREQIKALTGAGIEPDLIYVERDDETLEDCLKSLVPGDTLAVATLGRIHNRRDGILGVVQELSERGISLWEVTTDRRLDGQLVDIMAAAIEALDELANDRRRMTSDEARKAARIRHDRTPTATARKIWADTTNYPTIDEALAHPDMDGWDRNAAYRKFKARGTQVRRKR